MVQANRYANRMKSFENLKGEYVCETPQMTFDLGGKIGENLSGGEIILLNGGLGAGKTLLTKGILYALDFDVDEVTSPSFTLVNLYRTETCDVYHIDFWRLDNIADVGTAVGFNEILEDEKAVVIAEWSERLRKIDFSNEIIRVFIEGDGDDARKITIK